MALIKCSECEKEISDKASVCPNCGCPIKGKKTCKECGNTLNSGDKICSKCGCPLGKKVNIKYIFGGAICISVILLFVIIFTSSSKETLICTFSTTNNVGVLDYKITYTFENGVIKSLKGYQYTKPSDVDIAEYLWKLSNNQQEQYNYYDGLSYKATYSEDKEIVLNYSIDAEKAPTMFNTVTTLSGVNGITTTSTKNEVKKIFEDNNYVCK